MYNEPYEVLGQHSELLETEAVNIQRFAYDYMTAIESGDVKRANRIFLTLKCMAQGKEGIKSLREFYPNMRRLSLLPRMITIPLATKWVAYVANQVKTMGDTRIHPSPIAVPAATEVV